MKIKIFSYQGTGIFHSKKLFPGAEDEINQRLRERDGQITIVDIRQSVGGGSWIPSNLVMTVWYEETETS